MCRLGKNSLCRFVGLTLRRNIHTLDCFGQRNQESMSDFESLVKLFESRGFTGKEAIAEATANEARNLELERIKLEQIKQSGMNACES